VVQESNSHPFQKDGISFIHNGAIWPPESIDSMIAPSLLSQMSGTTDSERYFYAILSKLDELNGGNLLEATQQAVRQIVASTKYSSLNAMLLTKDLFIAYAEYDNERIPQGEPVDYYQLFYRLTPDGVVVASSGWPQDGWIEIPNHSGIVVDRQTLHVTEFHF
jgi:predicted glutamine amidotransferase